MVCCIRKYKFGYAWYSLGLKKRLTPIASLDVILQAYIIADRVPVGPINISEKAKRSPKMVINWKEAVAKAKTEVVNNEYLCRVFNVPDLLELEHLVYGEDYIFNEIN